MINKNVDQFSNDDLQDHLALLQQLYRDAAMDCPSPVPAFVTKIENQYR